jgi:thiol-disulfide isomerase/thioredoxin
MIWVSCSSSDSKTSDSDTSAYQAQTSEQTAKGSTELATATQKPIAKPKPTAVNLPAVARLTALDLDNKARRLSEWIGQQPVVINFWGTWCGPCRREIPGLKRLYDEYERRGVEIVSLAIERRAGPAQVRQFADQLGMRWPQLMANDQILQGFRYTGAVPTTVFLDKDGNEVARHVGARPYEVFKPDFEAIVSGS